MNVSQHADVALVQPLYWMSPHLSLTVLHLRSSGMPFLISLTVPRRLTFFVTSSKSSDKERNCPSTIFGHILLFSSSGLLLWHQLLSSAVTCVVCPSPGRLSHHMCNQLSHKVCTFWCQNTCFLEIYCLKITLSWTTRSLHQLPDFLNGCKMWKTSCLGFQICPVFTIACRNFLPSCQLHFCCP